MKKIVITIQAASDGGAFITMDPSGEALVEMIDAGQGTTAHAYALIAYRAMHAEALKAAAAGGHIETGEIPPTTH